MLQLTSVSLKSGSEQSNTEEAKANKRAFRSPYHLSVQAPLGFLAHPARHTRDKCY